MVDMSCRCLLCCVKILCVVMKNLKEVQSVKFLVWNLDNFGALKSKDVTKKTFFVLISVTSPPP